MVMTTYSEFSIQLYGESKKRVHALAACPFCPANDLTVVVDVHAAAWQVYIQCKGCGVLFALPKEDNTGQWVLSIADQEAAIAKAVARWNTRPEPRWALPAFTGE